MIGKTRTIDGAPISAIGLTYLIALTLLLIGWIQHPIPGDEWRAILILAILALLAELLPVPLAANGLQVSVTLPIICATAVVYGPAAAGIVDGAATAIAGAVSLRARTDIARSMWVSFNACQSIISAAGAAFVTSLIQYEPRGAFTANVLVASVVCVAAYMVINSFLIAWMTSRMQGRSLRHWLNTQWVMVGPQYLVHGLMALIIIAPHNVTNGWSLAAIFIPVLAARNYFYLRHRQMSTHRETLRALGMMIQHAHPYTRGHLDRVALWGSETAKLLNLDDQEAELVYDAALLHDIGKIAVNEDILNKPAKLNEEEWAIVRRHPEIGARILSQIKVLEPLVDWVGLHHERPDGKGYPNGHQDHQIPIQSKIIAVVDAFDAMVGGSLPGEQRPYRKPISVSEALEELRRHSGTQFDPKVVEAFAQVVEGRMP